MMKDDLFVTFDLAVAPNIQHNFYQNPGLIILQINLLGGKNARH